jgi:superfamily I DNA/RNA helicase
MSTRFEDVPSQYYTMMQDIIGKSFTHLSNAVIEMVFDTKKRTAGGRYVLGRLQKSNDFTRHLSAKNDIPEGVDYFLHLDKATFEAVNDADKIRIIRHELQHAEVSYDKTNPYGIRDHEINDFYDELEYNKDDTRWLERVSVIADALYSRDEE